MTHGALRTLTCLSLLGLVASASSARTMSGDEWKAEHGDWASCAKDDDCAMADAVCGAAQAVNRKFLKDYSNWQDKQYADSIVDCLSVPKGYFVAVCAAGKCAARSKDSLPDAWVAGLAGRMKDSSLDLRGKSVTGKGLRRLGEMPNLKTLILDQAEFDGTGLAGLAGLRHLQDLSLGGTAVGLAGFRNLTELRWLNLKGAKTTDLDVQELRGLKSLRTLILSDTRVTDAGLQELLGLTGLQKLDLSGTGVTDRGLAGLAALRDLEELNLDRTSVTEKGVEELKGLKDLRKLTFPRPQLWSRTWEEMRRVPVTDPSRWPRDSISPLQPEQAGAAKLAADIASSSKPLDLGVDPRGMPGAPLVSEVHSLPGARLRLYQSLEYGKRVIASMDVLVASGTTFGSVGPICWKTLRDGTGRDLRGAAARETQAQCGHFRLASYGGDALKRGHANAVFSFLAHDADKTSYIAEAEGFLLLPFELGRESVRLPSDAASGTTFQLTATRLTLTWLGPQTRGGKRGLSFQLDGSSPGNPVPLGGFPDDPLPEARWTDERGQGRYVLSPLWSKGPSQRGERKVRAEYFIAWDDPRRSVPLDIAVFNEAAVLVFPFKFSRFEPVTRP